MARIGQLLAIYMANKSMDVRQLIAKKGRQMEQLFSISRAIDVIRKLLLFTERQ